MQKEQFIQVKSNGDKYYFKDRNMMTLHREDGPAIDQRNGDKYWYINGKLHNFDVPAVIFVDKDVQQNIIDYSEKTLPKKNLI